MLEENLLLFVPELTPRLEYIAKFIFKNVLGCKFSFTSSISKAMKSQLPVLNYSTENIENSVQIVPHTLLMETTIESQKIEMVLQNEMPIFFANNKSFIGFDIFATSFYLLSRYEEYLPYTPDIHQRFPHTQSLAFQNNFLEKPLINIWCKHLQSALQYYFPEIVFEEKTFTYLPTYDIDIAYSYKHKGFLRNTVGLCKELLAGKMHDAKTRINVLLNRQQDPFDSFEFLEEKRNQHQLSCIYFFLVGKNSLFDKNILLKTTAMQKLIKSVALQNTVAIHPSYASHQNEEIVANELKNLENTIGKKITQSRQHYIKYTLPDTYSILIKNKIHADHSLGYGSINGFRASTCTPHYWFNVLENKIKDLQLFPFCWMDANSFYEQQLTANQAQTELENYLQICKQYNGTLITIWHNFSLGTAPQWKGWHEVYSSFLEKI